MNSRAFTAVFSFAFLIAAQAEATAGADGPGSAKAWLKAKVDKANELAQKAPKAGSPAEEGWQKEAKAIIEDMLDWETMTQESLGAKWKELQPKEQQEFSALLREIIEASYQSKLKLANKGEVKKPSAVKIDWIGEDQTADKAKITAKVKADKTTAQLEFSLIFRDARWRVWDVAIDDVSTVRTYRSQFRKHIAEKGFPGLMELMRNKSKEIKEGRSDLAP